MSHLITAINIGQYGGDPDWRCCQADGVPSYVGDISIEESNDEATRPLFHGFNPDGLFPDEVVLKAKTGGAGLTLETHYFVYVIDEFTFQLCASSADAITGTPVNVTTDATGVRLQRVLTNVYTGITNRAFTNDHTFNGEDVGPGNYMIYFGQDSAGNEFGGSVRFGICCAESIYFEMTGALRAAFDGRDWVEILLNNVQVYYKESSATEGQEYFDTVLFPGDPPGTHTPGAHDVYEFSENVSVPLDPLVCGNVIEIRGASGAVHATEAEGDIFWHAEIINMPPLHP